MDTVTISKKEYDELKKKAMLAELDKFHNQDLAQSLRDLIEGRITEVKIKKTKSR